ncbi:MAG: permease prefix domain 1-containing protein [Tepidiformaceae bacterium]
MDEPGLIDEYLDELAAALRVDGRRARRILAETEDHLNEAVRTQLLAGLSEAEAEREAILRFGTPSDIAARFSNGLTDGLAMRSWLFRMYVYVALLAGVVLVSAGVAGQISSGVGLAFGKDIMAGDAPGTSYTAGRCQEYFALQPEATTCEQAATAHHFDEEWRNADIALVLGVIVLGSHWYLRRRFARSERANSLPRETFSALGMAAFGVAAPLLLLFGTASTIAAPRSSGAQYIVDGAIALVFFAVFLRAGVRSLRAIAELGV